MEYNLAKRCISYDSHPLVNENAIPYEGVYVEPPKVRRCFPYSSIREDDILSEVAACCKQIEQRGIDITDGYDQWLKVGCSLATLGEDRARLLSSMQSTEHGLQRIEYRQDVLGSLETKLSKHKHRNLLLALQAEWYQDKVKTKMKEYVPSSN